MFSKILFPFNILFGISLFVGAFAFFGYKTGWYELAELYKTDFKLADDNIASRVKIYRCQIGKKLDDYVSGPRQIAFLDTGIYLNTGSDSIPIFNIIQPPLLIPWQEVNRHEIVQNKYHFYFGNPTISILILGTNAVRELEELSGISISDRLNDNI